MAKRPVVLVIGGGYGGLNVVHGLRHTDVDILLVDRHNHYLFQPLLYQVATSELEPAAIATPLRHQLKDQKNVTIGLAEVIGVDLKRQVGIGSLIELPYDYLVMATGVQTSYFGHDEYKDVAPGLKSLKDAQEIRKRILVAYEEAEWEADEVSRRAKLTFVIVGGGPTGVELAGAIANAAQRTLPQDFKRIDTKHTRIVLIDGGSRLAKAMPAAASAQIERDLTKMGVEIRLQTHVTHVDKQGIMIGEERIDADNVFWAAGVQGVPLAHTLGVELDRAGRVKVGSDMAIPDYPTAFVIGDAAAAIDAKTGDPVPGMAQGAIQTGKFVAEIIREDINGRSPSERPAFSYFDKGSMATIGRGKAVTVVGNRHFGGFLGFLAWNFLHLALLHGFRRKVTVLLAWIWNYLSDDRAARIIIGNPETHVKQVIGGGKSLPDNHATIEVDGN